MVVLPYYKKKNNMIIIANKHFLFCILPNSLEKRGTSKSMNPVQKKALHEMMAFLSLK